MPEDPAVAGDVNCDGMFSDLDIQALVEILLDKKVPEAQYDEQAADLDQNGTVTLSDLTALINLLNQ